VRPYIPQKVHAIEGDPARVRFCEFYLNQIRQDPALYRKILWSDECTFSNNGVFNRHNHRHWARENPHITVQTHFQRRFHINVCCGLFGDRLVGHFVIEGKLNAQKYFQILLYVENFVEELPLAQYNRMYFQQPGATPHNARGNANLLDTIFGDRWIGTYEPIRRPARSSDLIPLDFFLWRYLEDQVYITRPNSVEVLRERIELCTGGFTTMPSVH
jgi:hypothetical protein